MIPTVRGEPLRRPLLSDHNARLCPLGALCPPSPAELPKLVLHVQGLGPQSGVCQHAAQGACCSLENLKRPQLDGTCW